MPNLYLNCFFTVLSSWCITIFRLEFSRFLGNPLMLRKLYTITRKELAEDILPGIARYFPVADVPPIDQHTLPSRKHSATPSYSRTQVPPTRERKLLRSRLPNAAMPSAKPSERRTGSHMLCDIVRHSAFLCVAAISIYSK